MRRVTNSGVDFVKQGDWSGWLFPSPAPSTVGAGGCVRAPASSPSPILWDSALGSRSVTVVVLQEVVCPGVSERPPEAIRRELFKAFCNGTCEKAKAVFLQA